MLSNLWTDFRLAVRSLRRAPGHAAATISTLALVVASVAAVYSVVEATLVRDLPYPEPNRLVIVWATSPEIGLTNLAQSYLDFVDIREATDVFESMALADTLAAVILVDGDQSARLNVSLVTPSYFDVLGGTAAIGRVLRADEGVVPDGHPVVILSHGAWLRHFGGDPSVLGRTVQLSGHGYVVVGVMPASFSDLPSADHETDLWMSKMMVGRFPGLPPLDMRRGRASALVARLADGVTLAQAQAELERVAANLATSYPDSNGKVGQRVMPLREYFFGAVDDYVRVLVATCVFLLAIAVVNIANLSLVRAVTRRHEIALRLALGARRARLVQGAFAENIVLTLAGVVVALPLAAGLTWLLAQLNPVALPSFAAVTFDVGATLAIAIVSSLVIFACGGWPGVRGSLHEAVAGAGQRSTDRGARRFRTALVVLEVAAASALLVATGAMTRSLLHLREADLGFSVERALSFRIDLPSARYGSPEALRAFADEAERRLGALPGAPSPTLWSPNMPGQAAWISMYAPEGRDLTDPQQGIIGRRHHVSPGGLTAAGFRLLEGRDITYADGPDRDAVALVSASLAVAAWPGERALGRRLQGRYFGAPVLATVIGVVDDAHLQGLNPSSTENSRDVFFALRQYPMSDLSIVLYADQSPESLMTPVRAELRALGAEVVPYDVAVMTDRMAREQGTVIFTASLVSLFGGLALILASIGLFGLVAYSVRRRAPEIGLRMALGATTSGIQRMVVGEAGRLVAAGAVLGLILAATLLPLMSNVLFGVGPLDPISFVGAVVPLVVVTLGAAAVPALRASRTDPLVTLRQD